MLKRLRVFPLFLKRLTPNTLEVCGKKSSLFIKCRCLYMSPFVGRNIEETDEQRLEREAPFLFKAIKNKKQTGADTALKYEEPIIFQPILVKKIDVEDDLSHFGHDVRPSDKKEHVYVIQPSYKWGREKRTKMLVDLRLEEAMALINSVSSWDAQMSCIEPILEQNPRFFFGTGKVLDLSETIRDAINNAGVTMVFLNTGRLSLRQIKELEAIWGCKVFDRYRVVLELFKERAITKEAKLQVHLAEIQYMRSHLVTDSLQYDQQRGGIKSMSRAAGETQIEIQRRNLADDEHKTRKSLQIIKTHRKQLKAERLKKRVPHVAMVGYTNAGKTTLTKALSQDNDLEAKDILFATLDTTAYRGKLPSGLNLVFVDTVGFISDLPHELVESFSTTLEDVKTSDLLVHVVDCSHPEFKLQYETVEEVLNNLNIPEQTMRNKITVFNKVDLGSQMIDVPTGAIMISASEGTGIEKLRKAIEEKVLEVTGRGLFTTNLDLHGGELSWLFHNGTVTDTVPRDDGSLDVTVILDQPMKNKFEREFRVKFN